MRAHKDVTVIPRLVLSHSTAMPSSLSAVQLHGYTPAIISKIYYQSGSKNIIYVRERYLTEFWAQEVWRLLVLSESWHSWHYHKQTWGKKTVKLTHKNIFISNTIQIEPRTAEHNWLLDEEFMIIRGMLFVIQSWLFRSSLLLWTVIDNLILGRAQCSQTPPWPGPEPSSRWLRVGRKQNQWEQ